MKGEDSYLKDKLLDGGMRGKDKKGIGYRHMVWCVAYIISSLTTPRNAVPWISEA
jgi:hypothetical protein